MSDTTKYIRSDSTDFKKQVPTMLCLTEEFKCKAQHFHPDTISFAVMMGYHGIELSTTVSPRDLPEILRDIASAIEDTIENIPEDEIKDVSEMTLAIDPKHQQ